MDEARKKKTQLVIKYAITAAVLLTCVVLCMFWEEVFSKDNAKDVFGGLCNSFTVPGVVFAGVGAISYLSTLGAYDGIGYAFSNFSLHNIFVTRQPKKYKTLYEYKTAKDEKGRVWWPHLLIVGTASLLISLLLLIVYFIL